MAVIINFQEYVDSKKKKDDDVKANKVLKEMCEIIYFNREDVNL